MNNKSSIKHLNINITGRVQGVGFRLNTKRKAKKLGVKGFVRNEPAGSVYIEAEGTEEQLEQFLDWCRKGPTFARVENVYIEEAQPKDYTTFEVRR